MTCINHPKTVAVADCAECGRSFCAACIVELDQRSWCRDCLSRIVSRTGTGARVHPGWRKLAAALLSIVPGAGHMFLGLIGKGFALMGLLILLDLPHHPLLRRHRHVLDNRLPDPDPLRALSLLCGL